jgi:hypothetical protein
MQRRKYQPVVIFFALIKKKMGGFPKICCIFAVQTAFMLLSFINRQGCLRRAIGAVVPNVQPDTCCPAVPFYS